METKISWQHSTSTIQSWDIKKQDQEKKKGHSPLLQGVYILTGDPEKKTNYGAQAVRSKPREGGFQQVCRDREGFRGK